MMVMVAQFMRGISESSYVELGEEIYEKYIARLIYPEVRELIRSHLYKGHTVAVVSSATPFQIQPACRDLDVEHILCTRYATNDGVFTGELERPICFGHGKVIAAEKFAHEFDVNLEETFFYSDSYDDLQLLERVGKPRPLNPSKKLAALAERRQWPVRRFKSRGPKRIPDYARALGTTGSLVMSFAAGLPIWALTGSKRQAQNFSASLFADTASALIGLKLDVTGEENLWSHRPAVFVFNHQSKADMMITAKLLRRDIAGIGKKEIRGMPIVGRLMEFGGTVFIDRENSGSAIEAMRPLVDAMRIEGKSVAVAPEGTRTISTKLASFKKGPFHLAMQAGVPMVPIVIHNALDVAPKGEFVFRPATVKVDVLTPIDTGQWSVSTIDQHVADVRNLFLNALGQQPRDTLVFEQRRSNTD
jgi:putative phosphoserine phosphatase/1-acylglycerol-3-phosphate O-acyltransferase